MQSGKYAVIVDYGVGNHQSVLNAVSRLGYRCFVSEKRADIEGATALILPGVGAFAEAMSHLEARALTALLKDQVLSKKKPLLGICVGMQLMADDSDEEVLTNGLGLIPGHVVRVKSKPGIKVPHVGWNEMKIRRKDPIFTKVSNTSHFYFDHSYHFECAPEFIASTVDYGGEIVASVQRDHIFGVQFHPERSHDAGLRLFRGFFDHVGMEGKPC